MKKKEIGYRSSGKPYLADGSASISISHTKGYVAVLLGGPEKEVGIDVECYGERVRKVAHKFVREDESVSWYKGTETWSLLLHWSAKETMFKCMNTSDVDFRKHLHILPFTVEEQGGILRRRIPYGGETELSDSLLLVSGFCFDVKSVIIIFPTVL